MIRFLMVGADSFRHCIQAGFGNHPFSRRTVTGGHYRPLLQPEIKLTGRAAYNPPSSAAERLQDSSYNSTPLAGAA